MQRNWLPSQAEPVTSASAKVWSKNCNRMPLSIGTRTTKDGVSRQQSFEKMSSRAVLTNLIVPAVYHHQIREKLINRARTSAADIYSKKLDVKNKWVIA